MPFNFNVCLFKIILWREIIQDHIIIRENINKIRENNFSCFSQVTTGAPIQQILEILDDYVLHENDHNAPSAVPSDDGIPEEDVSHLMPRARNNADSHITNEGVFMVGQSNQVNLAVLQPILRISIIIDSNGVKLNSLIDTGCNYSIISDRLLSTLSHIPVTDTSIYVQGISGISEKCLSNVK